MIIVVFCGANITQYFRINKQFIVLFVELISHITHCSDLEHLLRYLLFDFSLFNAIFAAVFGNKFDKI